MSPHQYLREYVSEQLNAAAEEIFRVLKKIIVEYEEEIDRQRKLLDVVLKPEIKLHRIELPQHNVCTPDEEILSNQQLFNQKSSTSLDQEDPECLLIKEEQEELDPSQQGTLMLVKQEISTSLVTPHFEGVHSNKPEPNTDPLLLTSSSTVAESQGQKGSKHVDPESMDHSSNMYSPMLVIDSDPVMDKKSLRCGTCGKAFKFKSKLKVHLRTHTGEKPYVCSTCGRRFSQTSALKNHLRIHTGERPYPCTTCGKVFRFSSGLLLHMRIHTDERPYLCTTCGKAFRCSSGLLVHMRTHIGEKPYDCNICGKGFTQRSSLNAHLKIHRG